MNILGSKNPTNVEGSVEDIETETVNNTDFRRVIYTAENMQLVVMSIDDDIGEETHPVDQFFRIEEGVGKAVINGTEKEFEAGSSVIIPAGAKHNIINTGDEPLKVYTIYAPPHHKDGTVHRTKADAEADKEEFDGGTTE
jgi:mannose-6-phosphate isomerase-like protein (cupin superfamily)